LIHVGGVVDFVDAGGHGDIDHAEPMDSVPVGPPTPLVVAPPTPPAVHEDDARFPFVALDHAGEPPGGGRPLVPVVPFVGPCLPPGAPPDPVDGDLEYLPILLALEPDYFPVVWFHEIGAKITLYRSGTFEVTCPNKECHGMCCRTTR
jgi:hypothetical protein